MTPPDPTVPSPAGARPFRVVYLDDEPDLCAVFKDLFEGNGVIVETFVDAVEGERAIAQSRPDLVILDYRLPGVSGDEIAARLDPAIPKALVTGDLQVTPAYPFIKIFSKPFSLDEMATFIAELAASRS